MRKPSEHLLPNLLGIGAAKAGSTWLASLLAAHPDIYMPPQKELNALHYDDLDQRLDEYMAYFLDAGARRIRCDFSVRYLSSPNAPAAAASLVPQAKLVVVLRNPVDQIQSHYWHLLRQNFHQRTPVNPVPELFQALERYRHLLLEPALYGKHLRRWIDRFPRKRLLVIDYDDLARALTPTLRRLCEFLDVDTFDFSLAAGAVSSKEARAGVQPRGVFAERLFSSVYVAATRGPYRWVKRTLGVRRAETVKRTLRLRQTYEALFFKRGYPKLDARQRQRLFQWICADIEHLDSLELFDTSGWRPVT